MVKDHWTDYEMGDTAACSTATSTVRALLPAESGQVTEPQA
jgi:hypothetical protein